MSSVILNGNTSGSVTLTVPSVAGSNTITIPALTGTAITTASTSGIPNTVNWTTVQTSSVSPAVAGTGYPMNTTSGALTVTLPASPTAGQMISIVDYAGTAATNKITINPNGNKINGSTSNVLISTNREAVNLVYVDSTQGWLAYSDVYSTTAPLPPAAYTASYLVVAGGGGGGGNYAAGGGAGGLLNGSENLTVGTVYTVTVGAGGVAGTSTTKSRTNGNNSVLSGSGITTQTSIGGGYGGSFEPGSASENGNSGGSGGGGAGNGSSGGSGTPGQGYAGGNGLGGAGGEPNGGGGGGAGAVGTNSVLNAAAGNGGIGVASSITGSSVYYAGGGGGGAGAGGAAVAGTGGNGGGGNGSKTSGSVASSGTANTGGGGGGGGGGTGGGAGGSGVVILSVPTANYTGTTTGSPTVTTSGSNTILKYTASGTYTA